MGRALIARERQEAKRRLLEENKRLAEMAREQRKKQDKIYENEVDDYWFDQFGTTSR